MAMVVLRAKRCRAVVTAPKTVIGKPIATRSPMTQHPTARSTPAGRQVREPGDQHDGEQPDEAKGDGRR